MSLINDALKRAEADKSGHDRFSRGLQPLASHNSNTTRPRTWPAVTIAALVLAGITAWAGWSFFGAPIDTDSHPLAPRRATAAAEVEKPDRQLPPDSEVPANNRNAQEANNRSAQDRSSQRKTVAFAGKLLQRFVGAIAGGPIPKPSPTIAAIPTAQPRSRAVAEPAAPAGRTNTLSRFRLTGIIRGPAGVSAVINNKIVEPGQTIDGAKFISADRTSVTLEIDGRLHCLRR